MKLTKKNLFLSLLVFALLVSKNNIGLVLSGGGVKGFGHFGTLQIIDSLNIEIDYITGTSIGSIAAALYASGYSADEIERISFNTKWDEIFSPHRKRNNLHFFQKKIDDSYQLSFSIKNYKPVVPLGITNGQYSFMHLSNLFNVYTSDNVFDDMHIPFRCNAVDIISGDEIIFDRGSIAIALRASTSIPTIFTPVEYNDYLLIDGGIKNNLPTDILLSMGAESIIAVNVSSEQKNKDDINNVLDIISSTINISNFINTSKNKKNINILIEPKFKNINSINFEPSLMKEIRNSGKKIAYENLDAFVQLKNSTEFIKLSALSNNFKIISVNVNKNLINNNVFNNVFNKYLNKTITKNIFLDEIQGIRNLKEFKNLHYYFKMVDADYELYFDGEIVYPLILNEIIIKGNKKLDVKNILNIFNYQQGDTLSIYSIEEDINEAYYLDYFQHIFYEIERLDNLNSNLIITVKENNFKQMHLGATWDNHYKLIGKLKIDLINKPHSNLRIENELLFSGIRKNIFTLYYTGTQNKSLTIIPFLKNINSFQNIGLILNNELSFIDYDREINSLGLIIPLKEYGNISYSYNEEANKYKNYPENNNTLKYYSIGLDLDQLDNKLIPKDGYHLLFNYNSALKNKSSNDYSSLELSFNFYTSFNFIHTLRLYNIYNKKTGDIPLYANSYYGGYDWFIGYDEFSLSNTKLKAVGFEYQYHYKNSTTFRLILNKITYINFSGLDEIHSSASELPLTYGLGVTLKSILGPINFIWGRGVKNPHQTNIKKQNIFYFNFGVKY